MNRLLLPRSLFSIRYGSGWCSSGVGFVISSAIVLLWSTSGGFHLQRRPVLITAVNELLCISVNGKGNLSPQDKEGVEVSDDPLRCLRQSTKLKSSSCISLSSGAIGIISPFTRTSGSPCPLPIPILALLQAAGISCWSPILC